MFEQPPIGPHPLDVKPPRTYASSADLAVRMGVNALPQMEDTSGEFTEDTDRIQAALQDATALIDSYLTKRYSVPLTEVPAVIKSLTLDMARYRLFGNELEADAPALQTYRSAMALLKQIAKGEVLLEVAAVKALQQTVYVKNQPRRFERK